VVLVALFFLLSFYYITHPTAGPSLSNVLREAPDVIVPQAPPWEPWRRAPLSTSETMGGPEGSYKCHKTMCSLRRHLRKKRELWGLSSYGIQRGRAPHFAVTNLFSYFTYTFSETSSYIPKLTECLARMCWGSVSFLRSLLQKLTEGLGSGPATEA